MSRQLVRPTIKYKFIGYFDESEDQATLAIAGFLGPTHHWASFEDAWASIVREYGMPEFHMSDSENRRGFWESWLDPARRRAVQQRFIDLVARSRLPSPAGYVVGIDLEAYERIVPPLRDRPPQYRKPWVFAFEHLIDRMLEAQRMSNAATHEQQLMDVVFDEKDEFRGRAKEMVSSILVDSVYPLGTLRFEDSKKYPGLQAADLLAYEARRALTEVIKGSPPKPVRDQFWELMNAKTFSGTRRIYAEFWDVETLEFVAATDKLPRLGNPKPQSQS